MFKSDPTHTEWERRAWCRPFRPWGSLGNELPGPPLVGLSPAQAITCRAFGPEAGGPLVMLNWGSALACDAGALPFNSVRISPINFSNRRPYSTKLLYCVASEDFTVASWKTTATCGS